MKYKIVLLIILFPVLLPAQPQSRLDNRVKQLILNYKASWTLGIDSNSRSVDIRTYNKFKNLFDASATIDDDFNFQFISGDTSGVYIMNHTTKSFDVYAHDAALEVSKLRIDTTAKKDIQGTWKNDTMVYEIERRVYAEKPRKYLLKDTAALIKSIINHHPKIKFEKTADNPEHDLKSMMDSLKVKITKNPDSVYKFLSTSVLRLTLIHVNDLVRILRIENINKTDTIACKNDDDKDGILNGEEEVSYRNKYGVFTANGMPDDDLDGFTNSLDKCPNTYTSSQGNQGCPESYFITNNQIDGFIGVQFNSADINLPALNQLGYLDESGRDAMDVLQSKKGRLQNPGKVAGFNAGLNYTYFFGEKRKKIGISPGLAFSTFTATYLLTDPVLYTFKSTDGTNYYRRQVAISSLREDIKYNIFNFPLLFVYRFKPGSDIEKEGTDKGKMRKKWGFSLKAGPSLMKFYTTSDYNSLINFGGLYQVDTITKDAITYYDHFDLGSAWNILLTSESINAQNPKPGATDVFSRLYALSNGYDFADNKNYRDTQKTSRTTIAFNFAFDGQYFITKNQGEENGLSLKLGFNFVYAPLPERKDKYVPVNKTTDAFNSIYNSSAKSVYSAWGVNVGFVYRF